LTLESFGWNPHFARAFAAQAEQGERAGRVVCFHGAECTLWTADGEVHAPLAGTLRKEGAITPVTGDWVLIREGAPSIRGVLKRKTLLARADSFQGGKPQPLAANIDTLLIVTGLDGDFSVRRIERFLVLAASSGIDPVIVLSKADLPAPDELAAAIAEAREAAPGVPVIPWSAMDGRDAGVIAGCVMAGQTAAVAGSSGAGKSTLINRLLGEEVLATAGVRESDSRGRHTTTRRELIALPQGWIVADLPGLRAVGLWSTGEAVSAVFGEVAEAARTCRYRDCTHTVEPGCALREAVESGELGAARLAGFGKLRRETESVQQAKQRWEKSIARAIRSRVKSGFDLKR
jgi:ribosome biogenesis GTPase / thiamine phosphate phosphatase